MIRDFAGSYSVSEDDMAFGWPTFYKQFSPTNVHGGAESWDRAIDEATNVSLSFNSYFEFHRFTSNECITFYVIIAILLLLWL